jgi:hypothetical protein
METSFNDIATSGKALFFSVDVADFLIVMAIIFFGLVIFHWVANHTPEKFSGNIKRFRKAYRKVVMVLFYGLIAMVILNGIINKEYSNFFILIFLFLAPKLGKWYSAYDKYVGQHV